MQISQPSDPVSPTPSSTRVRTWIYDLLLLLVLLAGAYLRTVGLDWDQGEHLHPDERFMTMVESAIRPVENASEYFDTNRASLNPHNVGYTFYVYGTLPVFLVRYVAEWLNRAGYGQIYLVGRQLSGVADWLTILLVYLIASRVYDRRVGLLAAAFSAFAVLQIQLSHYFTVDTFTNFFTFLAFYYAVRVMLPNRDALNGGYRRFAFATSLTGSMADEAPEDRDRSEDETVTYREKSILNEGLASPLTFILFGVALGMALASKVSAFPILFTLPAAVVIHFVRISAEQRRRQLLPALASLALAALVSILVFRICQPYAFSGPDFLGFQPNPKWMQNLRDQQAQSSADSDAPFALQWARRPLSFAWTNLVTYGLGLPLGLLAWAGVLWMGWRIIQGEWRKHILIWLWTVLFFAWQSISWVSSMRYQLLIYPTLGIIAAWAIVRLWDLGSRPERRARLLRAASVVVGIIAVGGTLAWAFAFTRIYTRPVTRVAASEWVYQNVAGPLNMRVETQAGVKNVPLATRLGATIRTGSPYRIAFSPVMDGLLMDINLPHVIDRTYSAEYKALMASITANNNPDRVLTSGQVLDVFTNPGSGLGQPFTVSLSNPLPVMAGETYYLTLNLQAGPGGLLITGSPVLSILDPASGTNELQTLPLLVERVTPQTPFVANYAVPEEGILREVTIPFLVDQSGVPGQKTLRVSVIGLSNSKTTTATSQVTSDFPAGDDPRGKPYTFQLDQPILVTKNQTYLVSLDLIEGEGALAVYGQSAGIESPWDDPIPLGIGKYNPYDPISTIYRPDLNFEMYVTDSQAKKERMASILDQADYIYITSNRQWGTTVRVPERYPMTSVYYRALLGCPPDEDITWCYSVARPGMFFGKLGFELVEVFQSNPNLGPLEFNDQFAEEAFTVYDHPKVLIFRKMPNYTPENARAYLDSVDLSTVVHITPRRVTGKYSSLLLPVSRWSQQQAGGTWTELFDPQSLLNRFQAAGAVVWYLAVFLLGLVVYPLVRLALPGLSDRGYPLARTVGMLLLAWLVWMGGSLGITTDRLMITEVILIMLLLGIGLAYLQRDAIARELRTRGGYFLAVELVALLFFAIMLAIRIGNPDLWHPAKGGEKPMDFSYFNAILKSSTFPPYDPWFAGGYINYYYYGYVIVGVLVKWLGITPSVAYNLVLPTLFSLLALGAFSVAWNLVAGRREIWPQKDVGEPDPDEEAVIETEEEGTEEDEYEERAQPVSLGWVVRQMPFVIGLSASVGLVLLGNLGTVRMIWSGLQRLAAPGGVIEGATIFNRLLWTVLGIARFATGARLPYGYGDWYWLPSRAIPALGDVEPITEFPNFTFLYADLHAHMIALPFTVLALAWIVSLVLARGRWGDPDGSNRWVSGVAGFFLGGLVIGVLRPTNTWDFPTYLLLGVIAIAYTYFSYGQLPSSWLSTLAAWQRKLALILGASALLVGLSLLLYQPFSAWYSQGYNAVSPWMGARTPISAYLTHWGVFLFVIVSWMLWETHHWMATTPMTALNKLRPYQLLIQGLLVLAVLLMTYLVYRGVQIAWIVVPLGIWATILLLRPGLPDTKRLVLFLFGSGLVLTLFVELVVLKGDIGRMNTVFKFYLQVWTIFAIGAAASLGWLIEGLASWRPGWTPAWQGALVLLVLGAALFPVTAGWDKIRDRMTPQAPHTLDGMAYMQSSTYTFKWGPMDLSQDYRAIRWMQENIKGSPVIVEANLRDLYRWGSRMTIYTGLPGVVGWEWHQQQQRAVLPPSMVTNRIFEIENFYKTTGTDEAKAFLQKYNVGYIIVGQQERGMYPGPGLNKFPELDGILWEKVYADRDTVIYKSSCGCSPIALRER